MFIQTITFESKLPEDELYRRANERIADYRAVPGLVQKYYVKYGEHTYGGVMIWESMEAIAAFRETELSQTIATTYGVEGAPRVEVNEVFEVLRK